MGLREGVRVTYCTGSLALRENTLKNDKVEVEGEESNLSKNMYFS